MSLAGSSAELIHRSFLQWREQGGLVCLERTECLLFPCGESSTQRPVRIVVFLELCHTEKVWCRRIFNCMGQFQISNTFCLTISFVPSSRISFNFMLLKHYCLGLDHVGSPSFYPCGACFVSPSSSCCGGCHPETNRASC